MDDVTLFTEELLKQDYYYALLSYGNQCQFKTRKEMDRYHKLLPAINKLYNKGILSARLYDIANEVERYIAYGITYKDKKNPSVEEQKQGTFPFTLIVPKAFSFLSGCCCQKLA